MYQHVWWLERCTYISRTQCAQWFDWRGRGKWSTYRLKLKSSSIHPNRCTDFKKNSQCLRWNAWHTQTKATKKKYDYGRNIAKWSLFCLWHDYFSNIPPAPDYTNDSSWGALWPRIDTADLISKNWYTANSDTTHNIIDDPIQQQTNSRCWFRNISSLNKCIWPICCTTMDSKIWVLVFWITKRRMH